MDRVPNPITQRTSDMSNRRILTPHAKNNCLTSGNNQLVALHRAAREKFGRCEPCWQCHRVFQLAAVERDDTAVAIRAALVRVQLALVIHQEWAKGPRTQ